MDTILLPYSPQRDVYRLLQVEPTADAAAIDAAFRRLARTFHPDRNSSPRATAEMQVVNAVRRLVSDPRARAEYDRSRLAYLYASRSLAAVSAPRVAVRSAPQPLQLESHGRWRRSAHAAWRATLVTLAALDASHCPGCRTLVELDYRYCPGCGEPLSGEARQARLDSRPLAPDRRPLTAGS